MAEPVEAWWARRQFSRGDDVPYPVGTYREAWQPYPALIRQYHPEFNAGITLTQIPPAAEVLLLWQCEVGHLFAATPAEQRNRPSGQRRRSSWCPDCLAGAAPRTPKPADVIRARADQARAKRIGAQRDGPDAPRRRPRPLCQRTRYDLAPGDAFASECAPKPASAVEAQLRLDLENLLDYTTGLTAIRISRPFFDHLEVWPDIVIPELRIAVEYDSTGRHGLEHVGRREQVDLRKDRAIRAARWEVVRIRTGKLEALGPHDVRAGSTGKRTLGLVLDRFREIRGDLIVEAYRR